MPLFHVEVKEERTYNVFVEAPTREESRTKAADVVEKGVEQVELAHTEFVEQDFWYAEIVEKPKAAEEPDNADKG